MTLEGFGYVLSWIVIGLSSLAMVLWLILLVQGKQEKGETIIFLIVALSTIALNVPQVLS